MDVNDKFGSHAPKESGANEFRYPTYEINVPQVYYSLSGIGCIPSLGCLLRMDDHSLEEAKRIQMKLVEGNRELENKLNQGRAPTIEDAGHRTVTPVVNAKKSPRNFRRKGIVKKKRLPMPTNLNEDDMPLSKMFRDR